MAHEIHECWYIPGTPNAMIASLGPNDQLYIRGRSLAGLEGIFDEATNDEKGKEIHPSQVDKGRSEQPAFAWISNWQIQRIDCGVIHTALDSYRWRLADLHCARTLRFSPSLRL